MDIPHKGDGGSPVRLYKPGQGKYVRWGTAAGGGLLAFAAARFIFDVIADRVPSLWETLIPLLAFVALGLVIYWITGRNRTAVDFMIATEGEMKKVNWSSKREIVGATKVVIFTVFALALILFAVDIFFIILFSAIKVLRVDLIGQLLGGST